LLRIIVDSGPPSSRVKEPLEAVTYFLRFFLREKMTEYSSYKDAKAAGALFVLV